MTFIANPAAPPPAEVADVIAGDGWYPAVSIAAFRDAMRIPAAVTAPRVREALIGAMLVVTRALRRWRDASTAASLEDVGSQAVGGEPAAVVLWRRAVYATAAADLADTHNDISATEAGRDRRDIRATAADDLRRVATVAIRDLLGVGPARVRLL